MRDFTEGMIGLEIVRTAWENGKRIKVYECGKYSKLHVYKFKYFIKIDNVDTDISDEEVNDDCRRIKGK